MRRSQGALYRKKEDRMTASTPSSWITKKSYHDGGHSQKSGLACCWMGCLVMEGRVIAVTEGLTKLVTIMRDLLRILKGLTG